MNTHCDNCGKILLSESNIFQDGDVAYCEDCSLSKTDEIKAKKNKDNKQGGLALIGIVLIGLGITSINSGQSGVGVLLLLAGGYIIYHALSVE